MKKSSQDAADLDAESEVLDETTPTEAQTETPAEPQLDAEPQVESASQPVTEPEPTSADAPTAPDASALEARIAELTNDLQRTRADFENYRKQTELQRSQAMSAARFATVEKFLPLVDDFSRAITTYPDQLAPLSKSFEKLLLSLGLSIIESTPGTEFNPDFHEAVSVEDGDGDTEVIAEILRPGYLYEGAVLRPAMVKVGRTA